MSCEVVSRVGRLNTTRSSQVVQSYKVVRSTGIWLFGLFRSFMSLRSFSHMRLPGLASFLLRVLAQACPLPCHRWWACVMGRSINHLFVCLLSSHFLAGRRDFFKLVFTFDSKSSWQEYHNSGIIFLLLFSNTSPFFSFPLLYHPSSSPLLPLFLISSLPPPPARPFHPLIVRNPFFSSPPPPHPLPLLVSPPRRSSRRGSSLSISARSGRRPSITASISPPSRPSYLCTVIITVSLSPAFMVLIRRR